MLECGYEQLSASVCVCVRVGAWVCVLSGVCKGICAFEFMCVVWKCVACKSVVWCECV